MPAPLGNQYAKGHGCGRPLVYDEEKATELAQKLDEWSKKPDSLTMLQFYDEVSTNQQRCIEMEKKYEIFRDAKRLAMNRIGARREVGGLVGNFDSAIVRNSMGIYDIEYRQYLKEMKTESLADDARALMVLQDKGKMDVSRDKPAS